MNKIFPAITLAFVALSGCKQQQSESNVSPAQEVTASLTALSVVEALKQSGLAVEGIAEVTPENDENQLLGRPNQYISKAFFYDAAHPVNEAEFIDPVHTVEVFSEEADAKARKDYVELVTKDTPFLIQYQVLEGKILLRMNKAMLPAEVSEYEAALKAL